MQVPESGGPTPVRQAPLPVPAPIEVGSFRLASEDNVMITASSGGKPLPGGMAHPIFGFVAAVGGLGIPIGDLLARHGGSIAAGPLLGRCAIRYEMPLKVGLTYQVSGEVESVVRKRSRRFGETDHFTLRIDVGSGGQHYSSLTLTIIVPQETAI
ncbi:hypothetical protein DMC47_39350 [Nostoc sp. 3335mG]|nr:hypothetical protein DMC47_39350 [Nostoc sp. 3335mG]